MKPVENKIQQAATAYGNTRDVEEFGNWVLREALFAVCHTGILAQDEDRALMYVNAIKEHFGIKE